MTALPADNTTTAPASSQPPALSGLCDIGQRAFAVSWIESSPSAKQGGPTPHVAGRPVSLDAALNEAASLLRQSQRPLLAGLATDINGMRSAIELAERCGAVTDHIHSAARFRNLLPMQERGAILTTFAEVRNRGDLIVLFGDNPLASMPRFEERLLNDDGLFIKPAQRRIIIVGSSPTDLAISARHADQDLLALVSAMLAIMNHAPPELFPANESIGAKARQLLDQITKASYPVLIWNAASFASDLADMIVSRLLQLVAAINRTTRCAALPVGGHDGESSAEAVHLWRTGYPMRSEFTAQGVHYDPHQLHTGALLAQQAVDCLVWVATFRPEQTAPAAHCPTIVIGHPAMQSSAQVFIPVGTPGVHHAGHLVRADRVITLPTGALQGTSLPSCADVLSALATRVSPAWQAA